jgi:hypothetical protein
MNHNRKKAIKQSPIDLDEKKNTRDKFSLKMSSSSTDARISTDTNPARSTSGYKKRYRKKSIGKKQIMEETPHRVQRNLGYTFIHVNRSRKKAYDEAF